MSPDRSARVAELVSFALDRLPSMQLEDGSFCHEVVRGDPAPRRRSLRYTLIALLGLLRAEAAGREHGFETERLKSLVLAELRSLSPGEHGLLLWADARSGTEATERIMDSLERSLDRSACLEALEGLELAWLALGLTASHAQRAVSRVELLLTLALRQLIDFNQSLSGLLLHRGTGWRRRFPNFATEIYGILALAHASRVRGDELALAAARKAGDAVLALQRQNGGWPWLFDARRGTVIEPFEVYSTHQDGMAPMGLFELSDASGDPRYREAALRGLDWIWERNEVGRSMLDHDAGMLYRSVVRRPPLDRIAVYVNTLGSYVGYAPLAGYGGGLELNASDRPYHLGWILEAWCGREHLSREEAAE